MFVSSCFKYTDCSVTYVWIDLRSNAGPIRSAEGRDLWCPKTPFHDCRCFFISIICFFTLLLANLSLRSSGSPCLKPPMTVSGCNISAPLYSVALYYSQQAQKHSHAAKDKSDRGLCLRPLPVTAAMMMKQSCISHAEPARRDRTNWLWDQDQTCQQFHRTLERQATLPKSNPVQNLKHVVTRWSRWDRFGNCVRRSRRTSATKSRGWLVPSPSEDKDERFVGGVGVGLSCMQWSHGHIQLRPPKLNE